MLWQAERVDRSCFRGASAIEGFTPEAEQRTDEEEDFNTGPTWCRIDGEVTFRPGKEPYADYDVTSMSVEGFDPGTGEVAWSHELTPKDAVTYLQGGPTPIMSDGRVVKTAKDGLRLITFADGVAHEIPKDSAFLCVGSQWREIKYPIAYGGYYDPAGVNGMKYLAPQPVVCSADGKATKAPLTAGAISEAAPEIGESSHVIATSTGLHRYDLN